MLRPSIDLLLSDLGVEEGNGTRLSLEEFNTIIQSHLSRIAETQDSIRLVDAPFKEDHRIIQPVQCKRAISNLEELNELIQGFCKLLNETSHLPIVFTALRYRLLFISQLAEDLICRTVDFIDSYRMICTTPSQHTQRLSKEIHNAFDKLLEYTSEISQRAKMLQDEAKFQERRLIADLEEKGSIEHAYTANEDSDESQKYILKKPETAIEK